MQAASEVQHWNIARKQSEPGMCGDLSPHLQTLTHMQTNNNRRSKILPVVRLLGVAQTG